MGCRTGRSAVIIAYGREGYKLPRRFFQPGGECTFLEYVLDAVWTVADEIHVVFQNEPNLKLVEAISPFGVKIIIEGQPKTLVSNILTGIKVSKSNCCLITRENTPFLKPDVLNMLFESIQKYDAVVPRWPDGSIEPMLAIYRRKSFLGATLEKTDTKDITNIVEDLYSVKFLDIATKIKAVDPELESFFSVNSDKDFQRAREITIKSRDK